jgi:putative nucleotidyltransferase with HDIG domain
MSVAEERLLAEANARWRSRVSHRDVIAHSLRSGTFVLASVAMIVLLDRGSLDLEKAAALTLALALLSRVEFSAGGGFTDPTQIVLVAMLFLVPPVWVPVLVAIGMTLGQLPDVVAGRLHPSRILTGPGHAWHAVGPALVFALAGTGAPSVADAPVYVLAIAAQFLLDYLVSAGSEWISLGVAPKVQLRVMAPIWLADLRLSAIGMLAAVASAGSSYAFVLVLPLAALLRDFARERAARIDQAIELSAAYRGTALLLGEVITHDDEYTGEHSYGVISLSLEIADELGLDEDDRRLVEFGALLHDVGKIAVPKDIVNKAGPLNDDEWAVMRQHTIAGQRMLDKIGGGMTEVGAIVRASHERWDGCGYPDGKTGDDVPLPARIVSVADAFSAITTTRPYRRAQSPEAAVKELRACSGTQFDPDVISALVAVLARPAATTPVEFFARTAYPEPASLALVPDIDRIFDEQLSRALSGDDRPPAV